ncbi:hypothetical protein [Cerasicoccus arenae]|uniref:Uncharacterized protein n=1 Tax=Cerasicoccus arenae TaxID=424488 RepID=A0A8J3GG89_9BACT|nr:hypothetical protein [Cerasicoccus arenae]MBK1857766.1 hypothetical protein [Cerasicoccus arenae]GHC11930.1 hypothetical protein GCM10007047_31610 [Cerasicoccus arenae]
MTNQTENKSNQPDRILYFYEDQGKGKSRRIAIGALWNHREGEGANIVLDSLPIRGFDGRLVAFPPRDPDQNVTA